MRLIALTGAIASGKSSVARALGERGYLVVEHADLLKTLLIEALAGIGVVLTMEEIKANKAEYRTLLQELGTVIGFDQGLYIQRALVEAGWDGAQAAVIDNVRTDGQASLARAYGFQVVRLKVSDRTRYERLHAGGVDLYTAMRHEDHPIERGIRDDLIDAQITSDVLTPAGFANFLATYLEEEESSDAYTPSN
jgi:hypothetical protein